MQNHTLLVLGASRYQLPTIDYALSQGIRVIVADNVPDNPGHQRADKTFIIDTTDREAILAMANDEGVTAAIAPCTDVAVLTAVYVNQQLGNSTLTFSVAETLTSKLKFRECQRKLNLPHPSAVKVEDVNSIAETLDYTEPWIIKPDRSSGSKGIFIVKNQQELLNRFPQSQAMSLNNLVCLEQFIQGYQGTVEGWIVNGKVEQAFFLDRQTAQAPYVCTVGHRTPSKLSQEIKDEVLSTVQQLWSLLEVDNTVFDVDYIWSGDQTIILEASPRLGGNSITELISLSYGVDLLEAAVNLALGIKTNKPSFENEEKPSAVILLGVDKRGMLNINNQAVRDLQKKSWLNSIEFHAEPGEEVEAFVNGRHCLATVFISADSYEDLVERETFVRQFSPLVKLSETKRLVVITIAGIVFAACLVYLWREFQWRSAFKIVATANIYFFLLGSVVSIISFWIFRTLRWSVMLNIFGYRNHSFSELYLTIAYSLGLSMVMPLQSGEILKVEMLKKKSGLSRSDGYFALAIERISDIVVVLLITIICVSISSFSGEGVSSAIAIVAFLLIGGLISYLLFSVFADHFSIVKELKARTSILLNNPILLVKSLLLTIFAWACVVFGWWATLKSINIVVEPIDISGMTAGMTLVNVMSFIPGSVGVSEVGISVWLNYLGVDLESANAGAIMLRAYGLMLLVVGVAHWLFTKSKFYLSSPNKD